MIVNMQRLQEAFDNIPSDPCNKCSDRKLCLDEKLACASFRQFVVNGYPVTRIDFVKVKRKSGFKMVDGRIPSREHYNHIFKEQKNDRTQ